MFTKSSAFQLFWHETSLGFYHGIDCLNLYHQNCTQCCMSMNCAENEFQFATFHARKWNSYNSLTCDTFERNQWWIFVRFHPLYNISVPGLGSIWTLNIYKARRDVKRKWKSYAWLMWLGFLVKLVNNFTHHEFYFNLS